jgi:4-carboxymuconolactone decarboxylase
MHRRYAALRTILSVPVALALLLVCAEGIEAQRPAAESPRAVSGQPAPRLAPLAQAEWTDAQKAIVARFGTAGQADNDLATYLHHPVLAENIMPFERYISNESTLAPRQRELLVLRTAWLCRSAYVWAHHAEAGRKAGLTADDFTRIARGPEASGWDAFDAALLRAADELHDSAFVGDSTWRLLSSRYGTPELMDAIFTVAEFTMVADTLNSLGVQIESRFTERPPAAVPPHKITVRNDDRLIGKQARITPLEPSEWSPEVRQWLDRSGSGRAVAAIYRTYARHLPMDQPRTRVSEHIRQTSTLTPRVREMLIMRIGLLCRSEYEWAAHAPAGRRTGMTDDDIRRIVKGPESGGGAPLDLALLRSVDEIYEHDTVSDQTWSALAAGLDAKQLLDVLITTGGYRMVSMALNSLGVQLEPNAIRFPADLSR